MGDQSYLQQAATKVLSCSRSNYNFKIWAYVTGGGCSGFQYGFYLDETVSRCCGDQSGQAELQTGKRARRGWWSCCAVLVDPMSFQYLVGAEIDYKDIEGANLLFAIPMLKLLVGGSSFLHRI